MSLQTGGWPGLRRPGAQVRARSLIFKPVTPVLRALTWVSPYSEETAVDRPAPSGPHSSCTLRFPFRELSSGPIHFPLDLIPSPAIL